MSQHQQIRCVKRVNLRSGVEEDSVRVATMNPGQVADVIDHTTARDGTLCVRTAEGWLSAREKSGASTMEFVEPERWQKKHWVRDDAATECTGCFSAFGFSNRKHHCRACGQIFCSSCSSQQAMLPHLGYTEPQRVCVLCSDKQRAVAARLEARPLGARDQSPNKMRASACEPPAEVAGAYVSADVLRLLVVVRQMISSAQGSATYLTIKGQLRKQFGQAVFDRAKAHTQLLLRDADTLTFTVCQPCTAMARLPLVSSTHTSPLLLVPSPIPAPCHRGAACRVAIQDPLKWSHLLLSSGLVSWYMG